MTFSSLVVSLPSDSVAVDGWISWYYGGFDLVYQTQRCLSETDSRCTTITRSSRKQLSRGEEALLAFSLLTGAMFTYHTVWSVGVNAATEPSKSMVKMEKSLTEDGPWIPGVRGTSVARPNLFCPLTLRSLRIGTVIM